MMTEQEVVKSISRVLGKIGFGQTDSSSEETKTTYVFFNEIIQQKVKVIFVISEDGSDKNMYFEYILFPYSVNKSGFIFTMFGISDPDFKKQLKLLEKHFTGIISAFIKIKKSEIV